VTCHRCGEKGHYENELEKCKGKQGKEKDESRFHQNW